MKKMAFETDFGKEFENFRKKFLELEEKSKKDEMRCLMLETEVENLKKKNQELEGKITMIQKVIIDSTYVKNDSEYIYEKMAENKVLEREKVKELESNIKGLNEKVKEDTNVVSTGTKQVFHRQVKIQLSCEEDGCHHKKMSPSTPGVAQSPFHGVIDLSDEDVSFNEIPKHKTVSGSRKRDDLTKSQRSCKDNLQKTNLEHINEELMDEIEFHSSNTRSAKRQRAVKIITSYDEDSYDDDVPICTLKTQHRSGFMADSKEEVKENGSRRLRTLESRNKQDKSSIDLTKTISSSEDEEDNDGEDELESEGESLGGFTVNSSESGSKCDSESGDSIDGPEDVVNEYKVTFEKIRRKKIQNPKWDLEGDMLSDFGKDPELCMRAVCALYRQQTEDEKESKETIHLNERGFSQPDAWRASELAEFLMDGDPNGDLNKTVEELEAYDPKGVKRCMRLAVKYSKQLFKIYQNKEDPYFLPQ